MARLLVKMNKKLLSFKYLIGCVCVFVVVTYLLLLNQIYFGERKVNTVTSLQDKELELFIQSTIDTIPIPGISVIITNKNDIIYSLQYGNGVTENSPFALGSTSKSITAIAIILLLEEYNIEMIEPISNYLPWINEGCCITIKDLLNHTSGIGTYETIDNIQFVGNYGEFEYSNANYNLLGKIIEIVTGDTFPIFVDKKIFQPLNMENSFALSSDTITKTVQGYKTFFGLVLPCKTKVPDKTTWIQAPSGYMCASPKDMSLFLRYMLEYSQDGEQLLHFVKNSGKQVTDSPAIEGIYGDKGVYGIGWIWKNIKGNDILYHTGKLSNFCSFSALIPQKDITISVMCNMGDFLVGTNQIEKMYEGIISILLKNKEVPIFKKNDYLIPHLVINISLCVLVVLCVLLTNLCDLTGSSSYSPSYGLFVLIHVVLPIILIGFFRFFDISYKVVNDFIPDIFIILIICSGILLLSGARKILLLFL